jgi:hypothetical protein
MEQNHKKNILNNKKITCIKYGVKSCQYCAICLHFAHIRSIITKDIWQKFIKKAPNVRKNVVDISLGV